MKRKTLNHLHHALATDVLDWAVGFSETQDGREAVYRPGFDAPIPTRLWQPSSNISQATRAVDRFLRLYDNVRYWKTFREEHDGIIRHRVIARTDRRPLKTLFYLKYERALVAGMLCFASPDRLSATYYRCFDQA